VPPRWPTVLAGARWLQRAIIVIVAVIPLVVVTLASTPALLVLPFLPGHSARAQAITRQLTSWTRTLLVSSR
jgi:hypothetical protein